MYSKEEITINFRKRLEEKVREKFNIPPPKRFHSPIYEALQISQERVSSWFKGVLPEADQIVNLSLWLEVSVAYLLGIEENIRSERHAPAITVGAVDFVDVKEPGVNYEDFFKVPLVSGTIAATIGSGVIVDEHVEDWAIIHRKVVGKKKSLIAIRIDKDDGMSMYPILKPGDIVIIDREDKVEINPKAIYAVRSDNSCTVKRLQRAGRYLLLLSENRGSGYEPKAID